MSEGDQDDAEKEFDPSQKRLDDARNRGDFARSPDLISAAAFGGFVLAASMMGALATIQSAGAAMTLLDRADDLSRYMAEGGRAILADILFATLVPLAPLFLAPMAAALLALFATRGILFSGEKLAPKLSRISPLATAKQKFGLDGLFEFFKSTVKLALFCLALFYFLMAKAPDIYGSYHLESRTLTILMLEMLIEFMFLALGIMVVLGALDFGWQIFRNLERNRMTRKEMTDENKESEGDPHMKGQRRQKAIEIATNQMLADVAKADVVIVNPTHYAVALLWKRNARTAPICVAKGVDEIAAQIRARAAEAGIPIHSDPPTTRAIYATVDIGTPIRTEHFKAVAAAIRFAEAMRTKAGRKWKSTTQE